MKKLKDTNTAKAACPNVRVGCVAVGPCMHTFAVQGSSEALVICGAFFVLAAMRGREVGKMPEIGYWQAAAASVHCMRGVQFQRCPAKVPEASKSIDIYHTVST